MPATAVPAHPGHRGVVLGIALTAVMAVGVAGVALDDHDTRPDPALEAATVHGTRPPHLDRDDVARVAIAFGIAAEPEHIASGWEAEDRTASLYVWRSPSAWYVQLDDASTLLEPAGDRDAICAGPEPPFGCSVPEVAFVADVGRAAPDAATATRVARRTLRRAGLLRGTWRAVALPAGTDLVPCRAGLDSRFDCARQVVPTRAVMFTREFGPGSTAARWGVIVGPRANVLSVTGRLAEPTPGRTGT